MLDVPAAGEAIEEAENVLKASDAIDHPHAGKERIDAEDLMAFVVGEDWSPGDELGSAEVRRFRALVQRRAAGQPAAYITGRIQFSGLDLAVGRGAFIPRQSSEFLADQAIRRLRRRQRPALVDLATGIGPVALAVARAVPGARVFGADISAKPVSLARSNAERLRIRNVAFFRGDLFAPLPPEIRGHVDVITVHPPYVPTGEVRGLPREVRAFEPTESLTDFSPDGMGLVSRAVREGTDWLRRGGWLLVEVSPDRARAVSAAFRRGGFRDVRSTKGPIPVSRVVVGRA